MSEHADVTVLGETLEATARASTGERLARGDVVGRYVVLDPIGRGGMGEVYSAWDPELDRKIALKLILVDEGYGRASDVGRTLPDQQRLLREAQATARLNHPNVITVHDVGTHHGRVFVAMEFVAGGTLREFVDAGPHPWRAVLERFIPAGRGLAAAHRAGLVHRDFKPANVLVGDDGRLRVADFGLARRLEDPDADVSADEGRPAMLEVRESSSDLLSNRLTRTGARLGTPAYMAPEQYIDSEVDARADQFAFCVGLWEALYGERPFAGNNMAALMVAVAEGRLREPPRNTTVPTWLRRAVTRGLANDPAARWPSMDALLGELARDPGRRWLGWALVGTVAAGIGAVVVASMSTAEPPAVCEAGASTLANSYDDEDRRAIRARFERNGASATADLLVPQLDAWARRWQQGWREACEATHVRQEQSSDLLDLRMVCLERHRRRLDAFVELLLVAEDNLTREALAGVAALGDPTECADKERMLAAQPLPAEPERRETIERVTAELDTVAIWLEANELERAEQALDRLVPEAERAEWPPLVAQAHWLRGDSHGRRREFESSDAELQLAIGRAIAIGDDRLAVRAIASWAEYVTEWRPSTGDSTRMLALADALNERIGADAGERARVEITRSRVLVLDGRFESSLVAAELALALASEAEPSGGLLTADAEHAMGMALFRLARYDEGLPHVERALEVWTTTLGPRHRRLATAHNALGLYAFVQQRPLEAIEHFEAELELSIPIHGEQSLKVADVRGNLGNAYVLAGRHAEAREQLELTVAVRTAELGPDSLYVGHARANLANVLRSLAELDAALVEAEAARNIITKLRGSTHSDLAPTHNIVALILEDLGRFADASVSYRAMIEILEGPENDNPHFLFEGMVSVARVELELGHEREALEWIAKADALGADVPDPTRAGLEWVRAQTQSGEEALASARRALELFGEHDPSTRERIGAWVDERDGG